MPYQVPRDSYQATQTYDIASWMSCCWCTTRTGQTWTACYIGTMKSCPTPTCDLAMWRRLRWGLTSTFVPRGREYPRISVPGAPNITSTITLRSPARQERTSMHWSNSSRDAKRRCWRVIACCHPKTPGIGWSLPYMPASLLLHPNKEGEWRISIWRQNCPRSQPLKYDVGVGS